MVSAPVEKDKENVRQIIIDLDSDSDIDEVEGNVEGEEAVEMEQEQEVTENAGGSQDGEEEEGEKSDEDADEMEEDNQDTADDGPPAEEEIVKTTAEWLAAITDCDCAEDLQEILETVRPFKKCEKTGVVLVTNNLDSFIQAFVLFLDSGNKVPPKNMNGLVEEIFGAADLFFLTSKKLCSQMKKFSGGDTTWWNVFNYLKSMPNPKDKILPVCFKVKKTILRPGPTGKLKFLKAYQNVWFELLKQELPAKLLLSLLPYMTDHVIDNLKSPHYLADFFFKVFSRGQVYAILSMGAIFRLIVSHNFEYPDFFEEVYAITDASMCYMDHKDKFLKLLNTFLSSSHVPTYVVAGFIKRLCRLLLWAPFDAQEPLLSLVKNLLIRHQSCKEMMHRVIPVSIAEDPYDESARLQDCNALQSSIWEVKTVQKHWYIDVAKRANFVDKPPAKIESFVRFRGADEYFSQLMGKKYGKDLASVDVKYSEMQDGDLTDEDEKEENPEQKKNYKALAKAKKYGKFGRRDKKTKKGAPKDMTIPINFQEPDGNFLPKNTLLMSYDKFWTV